LLLMTSRHACTRRTLAVILSMSVVIVLIVGIVAH